MVLFSVFRLIVQSARFQTCIARRRAISFGAHRHTRTRTEAARRASRLTDSLSATRRAPRRVRRRCSARRAAAPARFTRVATARFSAPAHSPPRRRLPLYIAAPRPPPHR